jgi:integrase
MVTARAEVSGGIYVHDADAITVAAAATTWLGSCELRCRSNRRMERATLRDYESKLRLHILDPAIGVGSVKLSRLTRKAVGDFRDRLLAGNRSEAQTRKILSVLSLIVAQAQEYGLITHNPVQGVRVIRAGRVGETIRMPDKEEVRRLIEAATERFRPAVVVSALCGLRASELRGLRWADVDLKGQLIQVRQRADAFNAFGDPKSAAGRRSVPLGPLVTNLLKRWKLACPPSPFDLVFPVEARYRSGAREHSQAAFQTALPGGRHHPTLARSTTLCRQPLD